MKKLLGITLLLGVLAPWGAFTVSAQTKEKKAASGKDSGKTSGKKVAPASPIDLNTASQAELESIPGVGTPTAKKIIAGRPYGSPADLTKAGISARTIQEITPMVKASGGGASRTIPPASPRAVPPAQQPTTPPATANTKSARSSNMPPSGPGQQPPAPGMVWVNEETKVFHRSGDRWYGKTKKGKFMTEQDAQKAGYRESKEK